MDHLPTYSVDLIKDLDKLYPHKYPLLTDTDREIWYKAGQRSLIDKLLSIIEEETTEDLPKVL